ncbi:HEAT repeat domain-containing protein, partial [Planctomycetota bacterium]
SPPILEVSLMILGAKGDKGALSLLKNLARDRNAPARAEAVLALGRTPGGVKELVQFLDDRDPWVRYAAFRALREATGANHFADWLYGKKSKLRRAVEQWEETVAGL